MNDAVKLVIKAVDNSLPRLCIGIGVAVDGYLDLFEMIGLKHGAEYDQIRRQCKDLILVFHPDKRGHSEKSSSLITIFKDVMNLLCNDETKLIYNALWEDRQSKEMKKNTQSYPWLKEFLVLRTVDISLPALCRDIGAVVDGYLDLFEMIGLKHGAKRYRIKKRFDELSSIFNPDNRGHSIELKKLFTIMEDVTALLCNDETKVIYDALWEDRKLKKLKKNTQIYPWLQEFKTARTARTQASIDFGPKSGEFVSGGDGVPLSRKRNRRLKAATSKIPDPVDIQHAYEVDDMDIDTKPEVPAPPCAPKSPICEEDWGWYSHLMEDYEETARLHLCNLLPELIDSTTVAEIILKASTPRSTATMIAASDTFRDWMTTFGAYVESIAKFEAMQAAYNER